ncbi:neutral zinc metallopeptidase [Mycobacterium sp. GA-2829]|uniref:neutral zinc metallopeptidase n=1 Tax=Mycobacterium sp. GA-2829 TaxID=1772283 RepID=UPI0007403695|nr:neutral zinc metallopeptidase [Mycobacterium sp. GA-2829]KUI36247.1 peptidase [Mycobacterium sp. GA-2829]
MRTVAALGAVVSLLASACGGDTIKGQATSPLTDAFRVGGLPVEDGPSGVRDDAPEPTGEVENSDGGEIDRIALLSINDIVEFWQQYYGPPLEGEFEPVEPVHSYDSEDPSSPRLCGTPTYDFVNAFYCFSDKIIAWDRGVLLPTGQKFFGDMSIPGVLAHEYGHAVQREGGLVDRSTPTLVSEQQADCFAGAYMRWVAQGDSPRFDLNTAEGLNLVLAAAISLRDPTLGPDDTEYIEGGHGTAFERVSAFQMGFVSGTLACAGINMDEIEERRGDLPKALDYDENSGDVQTGELEITEQSVSDLLNSLNAAFKPEQEPTVSFEAAGCSEKDIAGPVSYCPDDNTIGIELPELAKMGVPADRKDNALIQGDNTAYSLVMSRYALALQKEKGLTLDSAAAALRTACVTGAAHRRLATPADSLQSDSAAGVLLTAGDLDEAVAGLLVNGIAASDVNGETVPAGFARIDAFRTGVINDDEACYERYP